MPGMFDDILADLQGSPQPAAATILPPESAPTPAMDDPFTVGLVNAANVASMGTLPAMAGGVNYALEAGAPGAYGRGQQRVANFMGYGEKHHPDASTGGKLGGAGILAAWPAGKGAQILASIPRSLWGLGRYALREALREKPQVAAETAAQAPAAETSGIGSNLASALREGQFRTEGAPTGPTGPVNLPPKLADALRRFETQSVSESSPARSALSAEMRAALKRGKFRNDYSTGEWADLLEKGTVSKYRGDY